jgi:hypothetical protein
VKRRAIVWLVLGVLLWVVPPLALGRSVVLRGTRIPWGLVLMVLGLVLGAWDWRASKKS